jgi:hypothetical protein
MTDLEALYELYARRDVLAMQKQDAIALAMKPVQAQIDEINASYANAEQEVSNAIFDTEACVKNDALTVGATIKGSHLMVVWSKGRTSWDAKKLEGMALLIPAINEARKEGEPTVSIRKV